MISDVSKYVDFLTEHKISEHQFLILWLVHTKDEKNIAKYKRTFKEFDVEAIMDLIDRGWIDDFGIVKNDMKKFNIYDFIVTDTFTKTIIVDEDDAYEELRKVYPKWFNINGKKVSAAGGDPLKIAKMYFLCHRGNKLEHLRILEITKKYFEINKDPIAKLENYIANKMWNDIEDDAKTSGDAYKML